MGGEIINHHVMGRCVFGPSPRGCGNLYLSQLPSAQQRAIPTWVGKSHRITPRNQSKSGHPHVGGEIQFGRGALNLVGGPSPRGWGNLLVLIFLDSEFRAIPTWVGKSGMHGTTQAQKSGHPHVGGEIFSFWSSCSWWAGPSPRGWGNPVVAYCQHLR